MVKTKPLSSHEGDFSFSSAWRLRCALRTVTVLEPKSILLLEENRLGSSISTVDGVYYDTVSFDIWGPNGRGDSSHPERVNEAFWWFFNNKEAPWIRWCIRNGEWWRDGIGWASYWDTDPWSDGAHVNHGHVTVY